jgi:hypothetical protein
MIIFYVLGGPVVLAINWRRIPGMFVYVILGSARFIP